MLEERRREEKGILILPWFPSGLSQITPPQGEGDSLTVLV